MPCVNADDLNISGVDLDDLAGASAAIDLLDDAIDFLKSTPSEAVWGLMKIGWSTPTIILTCYNENITEAESNIRDTNVAEEITEMTKNNIILQASQFMLTRANIMPESVLNIIKG